MEIIRLAKDVFNRKYNPIEFPVTLLGGTVATNEQELNNFLLITTWFTYRSGFRQFARSDCTSDKGWGCLIRTCQMMVARCLTLHGQLDLSWFRDLNDDACPFSIHKFIRFVQNPNEAFDTKFWTPAQGCEAIRNTLIELGSMHMLNRPITSYVCSDSTVIVEDVQFRLDDGMSVMILLPTVTGLHRTITQGTYLCLEQILQIPQCCGIVAGVPNRSYFIIGVTGQRFCFLDPHTTQPAFTGGANLGNYYETCATLPAVAWNRIDSSILMGFYIASHSEWDSFVDHLAEVKKRAGGVELFSIATKAMLKGGPNARKPAAQHLYMRRQMAKNPPPSAAAAKTPAPHQGASAAAVSSSSLPPSSDSQRSNPHTPIPSSSPKNDGDDTGGSHANSERGVSSGANNNAASNSNSNNNKALPPRRGGSSRTNPIVVASLLNGTNTTNNHGGGERGSTDSSGAASAPENAQFSGNGGNGTPAASSSIDAHHHPMAASSSSLPPAPEDNDNEYHANHTNNNTNHGNAGDEGAADEETLSPTVQESAVAAPTHLAASEEAEAPSMADYTSNDSMGANSNGGGKGGRSITTRSTGGYSSWDDTEN